MKIGQHTIGKDSPCYIIAELSGNHNQSFERAVELVYAAREAGANAIKLQTYTPDTITINCDSDLFRLKGTLWEGQTLYDIYQSAYTPWEWQPKLKLIANELGMDCFSSPFDFSSVDFLEEMGVPAYKIASSELIDVPLLNKVAATGKPVIISTGMATQKEIEEALACFRRVGVEDLVLLKCTSAYPANPADMNLRTIPDMANIFGTLVGLSDHSLGIEAPVASVALGAVVIEKHMTLRRADGGPDAAFSLEPEEFRAMVDAVRITEQVLGSIRYGATEAESIAVECRRSLFAVADIQEGEKLTEENVRSIRPGYGLPPSDYTEVIGRKAGCFIKRGTPLAWELID